MEMFEEIEKKEKRNQEEVEGIQAGKKNNRDGDTQAL